MFKLYCLLVIVVSLSCVDSCSFYKKETKIELDKNGYKRILVAIDEDVKENHELIERIKHTFTSASQLLFEVTKKRVYFKEIIILIPSTWKLETYYDDYNHDHYDNRINNATWETFNRADICIENRREDIIDIPFVVNYNTKCGQSSLHMHFTPEYFLNEKRAILSYGPYENVIVHEWSHFRYGVFDEYAYKSIEHNQEFYINSKGEIEATRCSLNLTGQLKSITDPNGKCTFLENGLPSNECNFESDILPNDPNRRVASIMYKPFLTQLNEFCDNDVNNPETLHNRMAPTLQNKECGGKSVWEVLRMHDDFRDFKNMPNYAIESVVPKFRLLKKRSNRIVLLIDRSIREMQPELFVKLKTAMNDYIKLMVNDYDLVGVIHFESFAEINLDMTLIKDSESRKIVMDSLLPKSSTGRPSNIWNALSLGLIQLRNTIHDNDKHHGKRMPSGGNLIIITNSKVDTKHPNRIKITERLIKNEVTVDTIEINNSTDETLSFFSKRTDGLHFLINGQNELLDLSDSLISIANREIKTSNQIIELVDSFFLNQDSESTQTTHSVLIDETISSRKDSILNFKFNFEKLVHKLEVNVVDPMNKVHELKTMLKCRDTSLLETQRLDMPDKQEIVCKFERPVKGVWTFYIINPSNQLFRAKLKVFVLFERHHESMSYYPNYYSDRIIDKRSLSKKKKFASNSKPKAGMIMIDARWSKEYINYPDTQVIYASISKDLQPILNASVSASILRPSGDYVSVELYDDGLNSDRFANDGIYTRQFSKFDTNGVYFGRIQLRVNENSRLNTQKIVGLPGYEHFPTIGIVNKLDDSQLEPVEQAQRTVFLGSFKLENYDNTDAVRPSSIKDLEVAELDTENDLVKIKFTAPGDDGDIGQAARYELKAAYDPQFLLINDDIEYKNENTSEEHHSLLLEIVSSSFNNLTPNRAGYKEEFQFRIDKFKSQKTISLKMRAIDFGENYGEWSPILTIKLDKTVVLSSNLRLFQPNTSEASALNQDVSQKNNSTDPYDLDTAKSYSNFIIFLISLFATIGIIQIIFLVVLAILDARDRRRQKSTKGKKNIDDEIEIKSNDNDGLLIARV